MEHLRFETRELLPWAQFSRLVASESAHRGPRENRFVADSPSTWTLDRIWIAGSNLRKRVLTSIATKVETIIDSVSTIEPSIILSMLSSFSQHAFQRRFDSDRKRSNQMNTHPTTIWDEPWQIIKPNPAPTGNPTSEGDDPHRRDTD